MSRLSFLMPIYILATTASSDLPPPRNVHFISENFRHVLTWENNNQGASVYYLHYSETGQWQPVPKCSNVTSQQCDLTNYFTDLRGHFMGSVQSVGYNKTSEFSNTPMFMPIENTVLGPPIVHVTACSKCVNVSISPPISHIPSGDKNRTISMLDDNVYPIIEYIITVTTEKEYARQESKMTDHGNYFVVIENLTPNTNYCVSVNASSTLNLNENKISSVLQCVITEPHLLQVSGGSAALIGFSVGSALLFLIGSVLCLIALDRAGYIFLGKPFLPKILKSVPQSGSVIYENKDELCSPASIVRMENTEPKVDAKSRDEKSGLGYAQRKKLIDSDQSTMRGVNNNALLYSTTSSSSGQGSGSSAETGTSRETAMLLDIGGSCSSDTDVPVGFEINPNVSLNTSGSFNINLNSVSVGDPENLWMGLRKEPPSEEVVEAMDNSQGPVLVVLGSQGLPLFPNKVEASVLPECDDYASEEELESDCSETSDSEEPFVSNYMRR